MLLLSSSWALLRWKRVYLSWYSQKKIKELEQVELQNTKKHVVKKYTRAHFFHDFFHDFLLLLLLLLLFLWYSLKLVDKIGSDFRIGSLQVVDARRILQINRKTEKYFKEFIWFWETLSQNYRRFYGSLTMFRES